MDKKKSSKQCGKRVKNQNADYPREDLIQNNKFSRISSVLNSDKAIKVNIAIMRAFVFLRPYATSHKDLSEKIKEIETKYDRPFSDVYEAINYLMAKDKQEVEIKGRKKIGYK
jgi:hypothetical protein